MLAVLVGLLTATWLRGKTREWSPDTGTLTTEDTESHRGNTVAPPVCASMPSAVQGFEFAWPMAASLLCAPAVFPLYLLWLLPFLTSTSTLLIIVWTVSIGLTYLQWHLRALGRPWGALPGWVMVLEYGCVATAAAIIALRRISRSAAPRLSTPAE